MDFCPLFVLRLFGSLDFCPIGNLDWIFVLFSFLVLRLFGSLDFCPIGNLDWIFVLFSFLDYLEVSFCPIGSLDWILRLFGSLDFCPLFVLRLFGSDYLVLRSSEVWNSPIFLDYLVLDYLWFLDYLVLDYLVLRSSEVWIFVLESILFSFLDYLVLRSLVLVCVILFINHGSFNSILLVPKSILE